MSHTKTVSLDFSIFSPAARRARTPVKEGQSTDNEEQLRRADSLLEEWYAWSSKYRPALGIPGCSPSSREAQSSKQWQSTYEIGDESLRKIEMESVEWCVGKLEFLLQQVIGIEMRNRSAGAKVWRSNGHTNYQEALDAILPVMARRGLILA